MFKNLTIKSKLLLNTLLVTFGLIFIVMNNYSSLNKLQAEYDNSQRLQKEAGQLKSMLIGGLMFNSAKGAFIQDKSLTKSISAMDRGIKKLNRFSKKLEKTNPILKDKLASPISTLTNISGIMIKNAKTTQVFRDENIKKSLITWINIKVQIIDALKPLREKVLKSREDYAHHVSSSIITLIISNNVLIPSFKKLTLLSLPILLLTVIGNVSTKQFSFKKANVEVVEKENPFGK